MRISKYFKKTLEATFKATPDYIGPPTVHQNHQNIVFLLFQFHAKHSIFLKSLCSDDIFASVGVRRDCSSVNTLAPCGGSLFSITSEPPWDSDSGAHDVVIGIRMRLQVNSDISDKLAV